MSNFLINIFTGKQNSPIIGDAFGASNFSTNSTNNTTNEILISINIGSSVFGNGDYLQISSFVFRNGANASVTTNYWINNSESLVNAIPIGQTTLTNVNNQRRIFIRRLYIANETGGGSGNSVGTNIFTTTASTSDNDYVVSSSAPPLPIDWSQDIWIIQSGRVTNSADTISTTLFKVYKK